MVRAHRSRAGQRRCLEAGQVSACVSKCCGPDGYCPLDETLEVEIPEAGVRPEPPFAQLVFAQDVPLDGPAGSYKRVRAVRSRGGRGRWRVHVLGGRSGDDAEGRSRR